MFTTDLIKFGISPDPRLIAEWIDLCEEGPCNDPFLRPEWFIAFAQGVTTCVILFTVRKQGRLRAILPMITARTSVHGLPINALRAAYDLNTPRFGLVHGNDETERREVIDALWQAVCQFGDWDMLETRLVRDDGWFGDLLDRARGDANLAGVWQMDAAPYIELPRREDGQQAIDAFFKGPRKHFAKELDRRLRRLQEIGKVEFRVSREYSSGLIEKYLEVESLGWKGRGGTAAVLDERSAGLHHDFARLMAEIGTFHAYKLMLDDREIAMSLNIKLGATMYHWRTSYDERFAKFSPGNLLFRRLLFDCVDSGVGEIDFLSPSTPNKRTWATGERGHVAYYIFRPSIIGRLAHLWKFNVISRLRRFKARYPGFAARFSI